MSRRTYSIPERMALQIEKLVGAIGFSVHRPKEFGALIQNLSDHFISQEREPTPWARHENQAAYIGYYLPLGFARTCAVIDEGERWGFFKGLESFVDFGSGPGTAALALESIFRTGTCIERSREAIEIHRKFAKIPITYSESVDVSKLGLGSPLNRKLGVFSYSLNELPEVPKWLFSFEAVMILEPSTKSDFRRFSLIREQLIGEGFEIWAPCFHSGKCPLANDRDWCHDRIHFDGPGWFKAVEPFLPMRNRTITFSYLLARRGTRPQRPTDLVRMVGDRLEEKGKTRQMICRGENREFLSWLHKVGPAPELERGEIVILEGPIEIKGPEVRATNVVKY